MSIKICEVCGQKYSTDTNSSCPYCALMNDNQYLEELKKLEKETEEYKKDTDFRIEFNPREKQSLKNDCRALIILLVIALIMLVLFLPWTFISGLIFFSELSLGNFASPGFIIVALMNIGFLIAVIFLLKLLIKHKYLMKHGIILRNVNFVVTKNSIRLNGQTTGLIKVKIDYTADNGTPCVFKGILPGPLVKDGNVCDVLVDPNNYKRYIIRYNID